MEEDERFARKFSAQIADRCTLVLRRLKTFSKIRIYNNHSSNSNNNDIIMT